MFDRHPGEIGCPERPIVRSLTEVPLSLRRSMRAGPFDGATHQRHVSTIPALQEIELGGEPAAETDADQVRIAVWNVERLRSVEPVASILLAHGADVTLLSEVDKGMVRSGNRHGLTDLAGRLGHHHAYAVEFVELEFGDAGEVPRDSIADNALGFHGNAVTSSLRLERPFLIRLEDEGGWFGPERGQQRVGGRTRPVRHARLHSRRPTRRRG